MRDQTRRHPAVAGPGTDDELGRNARPQCSLSPADLLIPQLDAVRRTGDGRWIARCPAHYDRHPSLSVRETADGTLLLHCWAGCPAADVMAAPGSSSATYSPVDPMATTAHLYAAASGGRHVTCWRAWRVRRW